MPTTITITEPEYFAFNFIRNHDGKGIPCPLPATVLMLKKKGLVRYGAYLSDDKIRCFLTPLGKKCFKLK